MKQCHTQLKHNIIITDKKTHEVFKMKALEHYQYLQQSIKENIESQGIKQQLGIMFIKINGKYNQFWKGGRMKKELKELGVGNVIGELTTAVILLFCATLAM